MGLSERDCLNKDILDRSSWLVPNIGKSQVHQCHDVVPFDLKNRRSQYEKVQRIEKDGKDQRSREGCQGNKINLVIRENSGFEVSVY